MSTDYEQSLARLRAERDELSDVLLRNGFVKCDISACNCGSWHHRYGLRERMDELGEALAEAGHPLCNENGNLISGALRALIAERDAFKADAERYRKMRDNALVDIRIIGVGARCSHALDAAVDALKEQVPARLP